MPTNFPTSLDSYENPTATTETDDEVAGRTHHEFHSDNNDAIEALQAKVGIDDSVVTSSIDYQLNNDFVRRDGTTELTGDWSVGDYTITITNPTTTIQDNLVIKNDGNAYNSLTASHDVVDDFTFTIKSDAANAFRVENEAGTRIIATAAADDGYATIIEGPVRARNKVEINGGDNGYLELYGDVNTTIGCERSGGSLNFGTIRYDASTAHAFSIGSGPVAPDQTDVRVLIDTNGLNLPQGSLNITGLTANQFVTTDASKNLTSFNLFASNNTWSGRQTHSDYILMRDNVPIYFGNGGEGYVRHTDVGLIDRLEISTTDDTPVQIVGSGGTSPLYLYGGLGGSAPMYFGQLVTNLGIGPDLVSGSNDSYFIGDVEVRGAVQFDGLSAGVVQTNASGLISSGTVDISSQTNLAVTSPVTLTGDSIGFDFSTNNTWTGTNAFNDNVSITSDDENVALAVTGDQDGAFISRIPTMIVDGKVVFDGDGDGVNQVNSYAFNLHRSSSSFAYMGIYDSKGGDYGFFFGASGGTDGEIWAYQGWDEASGSYPLTVFAGYGADQVLRLDNNEAEFGTGAPMSADDFQMRFSGSNTGIFWWREDEDYFEFDDKVVFDGEVELDGALNHDGSTAGFFAATPVGQQNVPATSPTVQDVIDGLVLLGLFEQSD